MLNHPFEFFLQFCDGLPSLAIRLQYALPDVEDYDSGEFVSA